MEHFPTESRTELVQTEGHAGQKDATPDGGRMERGASWASQGFPQARFVMELSAHSCKRPMQVSWDGDPRPLIVTHLPINAGPIPDVRRMVPEGIGRGLPQGEATRTESPRSDSMPV